VKGKGEVGRGGNGSRGVMGKGGEKGRKEEEGAGRGKGRAGQHSGK